MRTGGLAIVLLAVVLVAPGCGSGEKPMTDEEKVVAAADLSDAAGNPEHFRSMFVEGAAPDESQRTRYKGLRFTGSDVSISGDSATMTVKLRRSGSREVVGTVQWTAEKVGDRWKLKSAPLPEGL